MNRPHDPLDPLDPRDSEDDLKRLWRSQAAPVTEFAVDELRRAAVRFRRRVAWRNGIEYIACAGVALVFALQLVAFPYPLMRAGSVLVIAGALVVAWQLHARASTQPTPEDRGQRTWVDYHRHQLERQRDALRSVALWYIGPWVPGLVVIRWSVETELRVDASLVRGLVASLAIAVVLVAVVIVNRIAARKLQQRIDRLDEEAR
ncbi:hypothetical protein [Methylibium rhizosphaerae]|uniref:hypothetical protein n=1 Tax=Methylibium rhizosphaerae TaxID=2570323 RepID=UPI00112D3B91|nr:hypothetical protein [Methylibium rhizosphaerae]